MTHSNLLVKCHFVTYRWSYYAVSMSACTSIIAAKTKALPNNALNHFSYPENIELRPKNGPDFDLNIRPLSIQFGPPPGRLDFEYFRSLLLQKASSYPFPFDIALDKVLLSPEL